MPTSTQDLPEEERIQLGRMMWHTTRLMFDIYFSRGYPPEINTMLDALMYTHKAFATIIGDEEVKSIYAKTLNVVADIHDNLIRKTE